jgi:hypothetical protein
MVSALHANSVKFNSPGQRPGETIKKNILRATLDGSREIYRVVSGSQGVALRALPWAMLSNAFGVHSLSAVHVHDNLI